MGPSSTGRIGAALLFIALLPRPAGAQARPEPLRRIEVGAFIGWIDFRETLHEKPFTVGLRGGYRLRRWVGFEGQYTKAPEDPSHNFGQAVLLAGVRGGPSFGPLQLHGRVRAGALRLEGTHFRDYNDGRVRHEPAIDVGGILELDTGKHISVRIDFGRLIIPFGDEPIAMTFPFYGRELGTTLTAHGTFGLQLRF